MATASITISGGAAPFILQIREAGDPTTTNRLNPDNSPYNTTTISATFDEIPDGLPHTYIVSVKNPNATVPCATDIKTISGVTCGCEYVPSLSVTSNVVDPLNPFLIITPTIANGHLLIVTVKNPGGNVIFTQTVTSGSVLNVPVPGQDATYSVIAADEIYPTCLNTDTEPVDVTVVCALNVTVTVAC